MYWKYFVRETDTEKREISSFCSQIEQQPADGDEIKQFYEELTKSSSNQETRAQITPPNIRKIKITRRKLIKQEEITKKELNINNFFRAAQNNDITTLREFISRGFDLNSTDAFNWTALMCACAQGAVESVEFLVENGADVTKTDKSGRNAEQIAIKSGHKHIGRYFSHVENKTKLENDEKSRKNEPKPETARFYCEICDVTFEKTTKTSHRTSTVHLFCSEPERKCSAVYQIPEHNVGFRLLLKDGWDREKGLGVNEDGRKYPVKTVLKRNRKGLGKESKEEKVARVTHFSPGDVKAVENVFKKNGDRLLMTRSQRRKLENFKEKREKRKEKHFRRMFNEN